MIVSLNIPMPEGSCKSILLCISNQIRQKRLRLAEFFKDGDSLRRGICGQTVFLSAMTQLNISLSAAEISVVLEYYGHSAKFDYRKFLRDIESFDAPPCLSIVFESIPIATPPFVSTVDPIPDLRRQVITNRVSIRDFFSDFDPLKKGYCQVSNLKHVFSLLNLHADLPSLLFRYANPDGSFQYESMCRDIETGRAKF